MSLPSITAIIIAKNEEELIANCIETLQWCDQVIVVDDHSTDNTVALAERAGAIVVKTPEDSNFADKRNLGLKKAKGDWIVYIDADERVTKDLAREIQHLISLDQTDVIKLHRNNIHYGKWLEHGGWEHDWIERVFRKSHLSEWTGAVHESPQYMGRVTEAKSPLVHLTHRNMREGLLKSAEWTGYEAQLLFESGHKPVTAFTLLRKTKMEFIRRLILKKGYKDGIEGWIEALTQAFNRFIVYEQLWELQRKPHLKDTYRKIDEKIVEEWGRRG